MPIPRFDKLVLTFSEAIAQHEGYYVKDSIANINNNPGNLRSWGSVPIHKGFASFETAEHGWNALYNQVHRNIYLRDLSIEEFFGGKIDVYEGYLGSSAPSKEINVYCSFIVGYLRDRGFYPISRLNVLSAWYKEQQGSENYPYAMSGMVTLTD